jgi:hypothetical protein
VLCTAATLIEFLRELTCDANHERIRDIIQATDVLLIRCCGSRSCRRMCALLPTPGRNVA